MTIPRGAPPLPPDPRAVPASGITSPHTGNAFADQVRLGILAFQHAAELADDDQDIAALHKCIVAAQTILANEAKDKDAALGTTPAMKYVRRQAAGRG
jgi:hypothetical protein